MRNYQILDTAHVDSNGTLQLTNSEENPEKPCLSMSREGAFISLSASFGPLEVALRLRYEDLAWRLEQLQPVPGLAITRQIGTVNSYFAVGLTEDRRIVMRPTLVTDAHGHLSFNLVGTAEVYKAILKWLSSTPENS